MASICLSGIQYQFACVFFSVQSEKKLFPKFNVVSMLQINNILWSMLFRCVYAGSAFVNWFRFVYDFFPWALQLPYVFRFNGMRFRKKVKMHIAHSSFIFGCRAPIFRSCFCSDARWFMCLSYPHICLVHVSLFCFKSRQSRIAWVKVCMTIVEFIDKYFKLLWWCWKALGCELQVKTNCHLCRLPFAIWYQIIYKQICSFTLSSFSLAFSPSRPSFFTVHAISSVEIWQNRRDKTDFWMKETRISFFSQGKENEKKITVDICIRE